MEYQNTIKKAELTTIQELKILQIEANSKINSISEWTSKELEKNQLELVHTKTNLQNMDDERLKLLEINMKQYDELLETRKKLEEHTQLITKKKLVNETSQNIIANLTEERDALEKNCYLKHIVIYKDREELETKKQEKYK